MLLSKSDKPPQLFIAPVHNRTVTTGSRHAYNKKADRQIIERKRSHELQRM